MSASPASRALGASATALLVCAGCLFAFLPPMAAQTVASAPRTVLLGLALATSLVLHWVFLAVGVRRMGRSPAGWLALSVLLFPVGSLASLVLLGWFGSEPAAGEAAA